MRLELAIKQIDDVRSADKTAVVGHTLFIDVEELKALLLKDHRIASLEVDLARPGEDVRIGNVFDVVEPRAKADGTYFAGALGPLATAGNGSTHVLRGAAVVEVNMLADRFNKLIDMSGPGAAFSPYAKTSNVALAITPASGVAMAEHYNALKLSGLKAASYLARAARDVPPDEIEVYELPDGPQDQSVAVDLPRVAYIYMLHSHQRPAELTEPVLYGDNVSGLLPTILHPNEVLDGAVLCSYWNLGMDTYSIQNHPVIKELYARHLHDLYFAGVVVNVAYTTQDQRDRSAMMAAKLAKHVLKADGAVLSKVGGGIPETDVMLTCERCEELGVKTAIIIWAHLPDPTTNASLTFHSPRANAIANVGLYNERVPLPAIGRAFGPTLIGPFADEVAGPAHQATSAFDARMRDLAGALSHIGATRIRMLEY